MVKIASIISKCSKDEIKKIILLLRYRRRRPNKTSPVFAAFIKISKLMGISMHHTKKLCLEALE